MVRILIDEPRVVVSSTETAFPPRIQPYNENVDPNLLYFDREREDENVTKSNTDRLLLTRLAANTEALLPNLANLWAERHDPKLTKSFTLPLEPYQTLW
jgi:hypothetical protein